MSRATTYLEKAKRAAINRDWEGANEALQALILAGEEEELQSAVAGLSLLAADCEKLNLTELALWAYEWVAQIAPGQMAAYVKLATHYERQGQRQTALQWLQRGMELVANRDEQEQLRRTYRRVVSKN